MMTSTEEKQQMKEVTEFNLVRFLLNGNLYLNSLFRNPSAPSFSQAEELLEHGRSVYAYGTVNNRLKVILVSELFSNNLGKFFKSNGKLYHLCF